MWEKISDINVRHIWVKAETDDCPCKENEISIQPDWYENNGTPSCECGQDMQYSHTEINIESLSASPIKERK